MNIVDKALNVLINDNKGTSFEDYMDVLNSYIDFLESHIAVIHCDCPPWNYDGEQARAEFQKKYLEETV